MPQQPIVRRRQKARRSRQLAEWRIKQDAKVEAAAAPISGGFNTAAAGATKTK